MTIDLRSDTVTLPTGEMMMAMSQAEVGDDGRERADGRSEDPTVRHLENRAAELLGMEEALFVPSGTFGNMVGVLALSDSDAPLWAHEEAHVVLSEKALFEKELFGLNVRKYRQLKDVPARPLSDGSVLLIENTLSKEAGRPLNSMELDHLASLRKTGWKIHMDGARLFNAVISTNRSAADTVASCDTVMFCLSKGLGAPIGSVLCGSRKTIARARKLRKKLGGAMRQAGYAAAAGVEALQESNIQRLSEDHRKAEELVQCLSNVDGLSIKSHTNIILLEMEDVSAPIIADSLANRGILVRVVDEQSLRILTHRDVSIEQIRVTGEAVADCIVAARTLTKEKQS